MGPLAWLLWIALGIAVVTDWRERKIYNWLTFPAFALALGLRMVGYGFDGPGTLSEGLLGAAIGFVPFFALAWKGGMGMGDVKLVAVVGACLGWERRPCSASVWSAACKVSWHCSGPGRFA